LEEVEEIALGLGLDLGQGLVHEGEDLGPDLILEDALSPDQTPEIVPSHDLPGIQEETDLDHDQDPELKTMIEIRMEIDPHRETEMLPDLAHAPGPVLVLVLDLEVIESAKLI